LILEIYAVSITTLRWWNIWLLWHRLLCAVRFNFLRKRLKSGLRMGESKSTKIAEIP
jgi:hypothetical protein